MGHRAYQQEGEEERGGGGGRVGRTRRGRIQSVADKDIFYSAHHRPCQVAHPAAHVNLLSQAPTYTPSPFILIPVILISHVFHGRVDQTPPPPPPLSIISYHSPPFCCWFLIFLLSDALSPPFPMLHNSPPSLVW